MSRIKRRTLHALRHRRERFSVLELAKELRGVVRDAAHDAGRVLNQVTALHIRQCLEMELQDRVTERLLDRARVTECHFEDGEIRASVEVVPVLPAHNIVLNFVLGR